MQGIDTIYYGFSVSNIYTAEVKPWPARGGCGVFINLGGSAGFNDSYIYEFDYELDQTGFIDELIQEGRSVRETGDGVATIW